MRLPPTAVFSRIFHYHAERRKIMPALDDHDRAILRVLQRDGKISMQDLADRVALSVSPCWRRVRKLEEAGIITGYVALVSPDQVGLTISAFVRVRLNQQDEKHLDIFETAVAAFTKVGSELGVLGSSV